MLLSFEWEKITRKNLQLVDYKFQRHGDPFLFLNPNEAFQSQKTKQKSIDNT
jgi:hypothetical protein